LIVVILVQWWAVSLVKAVPFAGKTKGADAGIDGLIYFKGLSWLEGHDGIFIVLRDNPARENHGGYFRNGLLRNPETGWPTDPGQPRPRPAFNWWY
jgi:hypothetical protein